MKLQGPLPKPWSIPGDLKKAYSKQKIEEFLHAINKVGENNYYIRDFFNQRLIMASFSGLEPHGYSKDVIEKEKTVIFSKMLSVKEQNWLLRTHLAANKIFYSYPISRRKDFIFTFDEIARTPSGEKIILRQITTPFQLDKNGNLWLGLSRCVVVSQLQTPSKAVIIDYKTGEKFELRNGKFQLSSDKVLDAESQKILSWLAKDQTTTQICTQLDISESSLMRKKRKIYDQLGVASSSAAIYKATIMGLI